MGRQCDQCAKGFYNIQSANPLGCEQCLCNTAGTIGADISCHPTLGTCFCKINVQGKTCDVCQFGFYNLDSTNSNGCSPCQCHAVGSTSAYCNPDMSGQCNCRPNIMGQTCDTCTDDFYDFDGGCLHCGCNTDGTVPGSFCDKMTGQCVCKSNVQGMRCDDCMDGFYNLGSSVQFGCSSCGCNSAGLFKTMVH